ncbi:MAG TPA: hypothetical protein VHO70_05010 [Chitinispirillaceae bacterium]|nr:hypothetical protein [Chitinispirillaceae bacterium]
MVCSFCREALSLLSIIKSLSSDSADSMSHTVSNALFPVRLTIDNVRCIPFILQDFIAISSKYHCK